MLEWVFVLNGKVEKRTKGAPLQEDVAADARELHTRGNVTQKQLKRRTVRRQGIISITLLEVLKAYILL